MKKSYIQLPTLFRFSGVFNYLNFRTACIAATFDVKGHVMSSAVSQSRPTDLCNGVAGRIDG
jgi:hypothetical protein